MKKFLLTLVACLTLAFTLPQQAHALTAKDLDGLYYGAYMIGMENGQRSSAVSGFSGKFEMRGSQLYMTHFLGILDIPVSVNGDNVTLSTSYMTPTSENYKNSQIRIERATKKWEIENPWYVSGGYVYQYKYRTFDFGERRAEYTGK